MAQWPYSAVRTTTQSGNFSCLAASSPLDLAYRRQTRQPKRMYGLQDGEETQACADPSTSPHPLHPVKFVGTRD